jgi:hypothetical protein
MVCVDAFQLASAPFDGLGGRFWIFDFGLGGTIESKRFDLWLQLASCTKVCKSIIINGL